MASLHENWLPVMRNTYLLLFRLRATKITFGMFYIRYHVGCIEYIVMNDPPAGESEIRWTPILELVLKQREPAE